MDLSPRSFLEDREGETFTLEAGAGARFEARLHSVDVVGAGDSGSLVASFAVDPGVTLQQGIYAFAHATAGPVELFAVPSGPAELSVTITWSERGLPAG